MRLLFEVIKVNMALAKAMFTLITSKSNLHDTIIGGCLFVSIMNSARNKLNAPSYFVCLWLFKEAAIYSVKFHNTIFNLYIHSYTNQK